MKTNYLDKDGKLSLDFINDFIDKYIRPQTENIIVNDNNIIIIYPENFKYPDYISNKEFNYFIGFMTDDQKSEMIENIRNFGFCEEFDFICGQNNEIDKYITDTKDEHKFSEEFYHLLYEQIYVNICTYANRDIKTIGINELK